MTRYGSTACRLLIAFGLVCAAGLARAEVRIDITRGNPQPMPIAVTDLSGVGAGDGSRYGRDIAAAVAADLERSGLFKPIDKAAHVQQPEAIGAQPRFSDWRVIGAQALVSGNAAMLGDGRLRVEFRLWDVFGEMQMEGQALTAPSQGWRRVAHKIADAIYKRITGEEGYFDTQIIYIAETGPQTKRIKRLAIMDQDGAENRFLTDVYKRQGLGFGRPRGR